MRDDGTARGLGVAEGLFRRPALADAAVGGKARSLARLAALGLPVPPAFVIVSRPGAPIIEADGPAPPPTLRTPSDLAALDEARAALLRGPFCAAFGQGLDQALAALAPDHQEATFSVRSSAALQDSAQGAAPGVFDSVLRVPRARVAEAVRAVLASALAPAAWAYVSRAATQAQGAIAVLLHRFVAGDAHGAVVCEPVGGEARVQIDVQHGTLAAGARATIEAGARRAAQLGPVELEWTAAGDDVTFLQLRPYTPSRAAPASGRAPEPGWVWDAAHNPTPLTPAQAGLVEWVDARCTLPFRQRVVDGYLFHRAAQAAAPPGQPRQLFQRLQADVRAEVAALGSEPRLGDALEVYTRGYQGLFGTVQPACTAARAALRDFLQAHAPAALASWPALVEAGVTSAATRRRAGAAAIGAAPDGAARAAAIAAYLQSFGAESARWDVAEPTLRERPEALLFVGSRAGGLGPTALAHGESKGHSQGPFPSPAASEPVLAAGGGAVAGVAEFVSSWPEAGRADLQARLTAAREAAAVAEDDDALFAELQAVVRAALLALGRRLVSDGRLADAGDIFFLPLEVARAVDDGAQSPAALVPLAAAGRAAFAAAAAHPPPPPVPSQSSAHAVAGQSGAGGRAIGRVVLHPSPVVPGPTGPAVIVAATLLPTELPLLDAAALVVETGTPLGHVAAQARERGIPAVVAAPGACAALRAGQLVLVDGDRGVVIPLEAAPTSPA